MNTGCNDGRKHRAAWAMFAGMGLAAAAAGVAWAQSPLLAERDEAPGAPRTTPQALRDVGQLLGVFSATELPANQRATHAVTVFGDTLIEGELTEHCATVFGNTRITGRIRGESVTVFGDLDLNGVVEREVVVVLGNARFGPQAEVKGNCHVIGGRILAEPGAVFHRQKQQIAGFLPGIGDWFKYGLLWGRPLVPSLGWVWALFGLHFLVYFLVALLLPRPVEACERALQDQGLAAFGVGLLGLFLFWPAMGVVAVTLAGVPLLPFLLLAAFGAVLLGKTAAFQWLGRTLLRRCGLDTSDRAMAGFLVGCLMMTVVYLVPVLGLVAWGVLLPLGFGAALMALVQVIRESRPPRPPGVPPSPAAPWPPGALSGPGATSTGSAAAMPDAEGAAAMTVLRPPLAVEMAALPRAGFWIRLAATLLDLVLLAWFAHLVRGYFPLLWLAYHVGMWVWKGTTIGGIVCSLKVVREDGRPLDFTVALVRALAAVFSLVALGLGFFWAGWSPERQSWHDKIAGTVIVRVPKGISLI